MYDWELWAIVWAVRHFRHYLGLRPFTIVTDHWPLLGLRRLPIDNDSTVRCSHWALELDPYDWVIMHKSGSQHTNADALSRRPDLRAELMDSPPESPDTAHTLVHTGTQTVMDNDPSVVCVIETPPSTMAPTAAPGSTPNSHLPSDPQTGVD